MLKLSEGKETWVGTKAVYRTVDAEGKIAGDVLALAEETPPEGAGRSLLEPVMRGGELLRPHPPLAEIRGHCPAELAALPDALRRLEGPAVYPVRPPRGATAAAGARGGRRAPLRPTILASCQKESATIRIRSSPATHPGTRDSA